MNPPSIVAMIAEACMALVDADSTTVTCLLVYANGITSYSDEADPQQEKNRL